MQQPNYQEIQQEIAVLQEQAKQQKPPQESFLLRIITKMLEQPHDFIWFARKKLKEK
jgi:hypothetical protein